MIALKLSAYIKGTCSRQCALAYPSAQLVRVTFFLTALSVCGAQGSQLSASTNVACLTHEDCTKLLAHKRKRGLCLRQCVLLKMMADSICLPTNMASASAIVSPLFPGSNAWPAIFAKALNIWNSAPRTPCQRENCLELSKKSQSQPFLEPFRGAKNGRKPWSFLQKQCFWTFLDAFAGNKN